jgi:hypothetical protein
VKQPSNIKSTEAIMQVEVGKEIETARHRLSDIIFFCEKTCPIENATWEEYAKAAMRMIARSAREATDLLALVQTNE